MHMTLKLSNWFRSDIGLLRVQLDVVSTSDALDSELALRMRIVNTYVPSVTSPGYLLYQFCALCS